MWLAAVVVALCFWPTPAPAGTQTYGRVTVSVEPPAQVSSRYGYAVYRMTVSNRGGTSRRVTVTLPSESWGHGDTIDRLSRTVRVEPNSTAVAELLQPPLGMYGNDARVSIDGRPQRERVSVSILNHHNSYDGEPILFSRGVAGPIGAGFETAMNAIAEKAAASGGGRYGPYSNRLSRMALADRPVGEWSGSWLAYSRYLMVMISEEELRGAPREVDAALRDYVASGGQLVVVGKGGAVPGLGPAWARAVASHRQAYSSRLRVGLGEAQLLTADDLAGFDTDAWKHWVEQSIKTNRPRVTRLDPNSAEGRLPMLESIQVPARGLLVTMLVFTLLIGPGNILVLTLLKRRMWLLWTIPVIAFVFAGAVLAYSLMSEGIKPRARTTAVTLLNQTTRQAVTLALTGYYAPLTPGDGLRFGYQTRITPQTGELDYYAYHGNGRSRRMDVTNGQHLSRGWVVARIPAHFELCTVEARRERLEISRSGDGGLSVVNGLGMPIQQLRVIDKRGLRYEAGPLPAGASVELGLSEGASASSDAETAMIKQGWEAAQSIASDPAKYVQPGRYVAVLDNASFAEPGLTGLTEHETTGVVIGLWEEAE